AQFDELKGLQRGHVELAVVEGCLAEFVPDVLARFNRAHPHVSVSVEVAGSDSVMRQVLAANAEIGLLFYLPLRPTLRVVQAARSPTCRWATPPSPPRCSRSASPPTATSPPRRRSSPSISARRSLRWLDMGKTASVSVRLPESLNDQIGEIAAALDRPKSWVI